jgi:hypothetical protein
MAAADVEVVNIIRVRVDDVGTVYTSDTLNRSIAQNLKFTDDWRIEPDSTIPETAGYPTLKVFLKAMASRGTPHRPMFISQNLVVTVKV